jgi:uncharacterized phage infection (PIP) family protein YhgE
MIKIISKKKYNAIKDAIEFANKIFEENEQLKNGLLLDQYKQKMEEITKTNKQYRATIDELNDEIKELTAIIKKQKKQINKLEHLEQTAWKKLNKCREENKVLNSIIDSLKDISDKLTQKVKQINEPQSVEIYA